MLLALRNWLLLLQDVPFAGGVSRAGPAPPEGGSRQHGLTTPGEAELMDLDETHQPKGAFECHLCKLCLPYSYFGQKPPSAPSVVLLEECYVTKDPFSPDKEKFLILGSRCDLCHQVVCVSTDCSLFYSKRFCLPCVLKHKSDFPLEIQQDVDKRTVQSK